MPCNLNSCFFFCIWREWFVSIFAQLWWIQFISNTAMPTIEFLHSEEFKLIHFTIILESNGVWTDEIDCFLLIKSTADVNVVMFLQNSAVWTGIFVTKCQTKTLTTFPGVCKASSLRCCVQIQLKYTLTFKTGFISNNSTQEKCVFLVLKQTGNKVSWVIT